MDSDLSNSLTNNQDGKLASGDASSTNSLVLSPSLTDLLPHPDTEPHKEETNAEIWRYEVPSLELLPKERVRCTPKFYPMGSLRKNQYQVNSKTVCKISLNKGVKQDSKSTARKNENPKGSHSNECFTPRESQPALQFVKMAKLFMCQACQMSPITSLTVHMCKQGHQECGNCFNYNPKCVVCGELLEGRNQPVEAALQKLKILQPELFFQEFLGPANTDGLEDMGHSKAAIQSSHKPIQCPHLACRSTVAYNGFLLHFKFEHTSVPVLSTSPNCLHQLPLHESLIHHTFATVSIVFKVILDKNVPKKYDGDPVICCLLSTPIQLGHVKSLGVWCSCLYDEGTSAPLTYTLMYANSRRSVGYQGPVTSLQESTESIAKDGRCLIIPPEMLENFPLQTENSNILHIEFFINS